MPSALQQSHSARRAGRQQALSPGRRRPSSQPGPELAVTQEEITGGKTSYSLSSFIFLRVELCGKASHW